MHRSIRMAIHIVCLLIVVLLHAGCVRGPMTDDDMVAAVARLEGIQTDHGWELRRSPPTARWTDGASPEGLAMASHVGSDHAQPERGNTEPHGQRPPDASDHQIRHGFYHGHARSMDQP